MTKNTETKKISATFIGDEAITADLLEKAIRLNNFYKSKVERDNALVSLGLSTIQFCIEKYKEENFVKYPSYKDITNFLAKKRD